MAATGATPTATTGAHPSQQLSLEAQKILAKPPRSLWTDAWLRLKRNKAAMVSIVFIIILSLVAIFAPLVAPHNPLDQNTSNSFRQAAWIQTDGKDTGDWRWPLGTDNLGRDVWSRLVYGTRVSLAVGLVPMIIIVSVGMAVGLAAGFAGGMVDNLSMRGIDIVLAFPDLLLFIIATVALRDTPIGRIWGGLLLLFIVLALLGWAGLARLVRGQVLGLKEKEYVEAAQSIGSSRKRIMFRHLMPNTLSPVIVSAAFLVPTAILAEATLGYLGLGVRPATDPNAPFPTSWGSMLLEGNVALSNQPWMMLAPAIAVALVLLAFTFLGDGLRDALDPRMKQ